MDVVIVLLVSAIFLNYVHELGHLITAKLVRMPIVKMYLGIGPAIYTRRMGETDLIFGPLFGASMQPRQQDFRDAPARDRLMVSSAGPFANFFVTFVLLAIAYVGFPAPPSATVGAVEPGGQFDTLGIGSGDQIVMVNHVGTETWSDVGIELISRAGDSGVIPIGVLTNGEVTEVELEVEDWQSDVVWINMYEALGVSPDLSVVERSSLLGGIADGAVDTVRIFWSSVMSGFRMLAGDLRALNFAGGMQLTQLGIDRTNISIGDYIKLIALFSLCFGIINSLPGPIVDGLAMIVSAVEWVYRKRLNPMLEKVATYVGVVLAFGPLGLFTIYELIRIFD